MSRIAIIRSDSDMADDLKDETVELLESIPKEVAISTILTLSFTLLSICKGETPHDKFPKDINALVGSVLEKVTDAIVMSKLVDAIEAMSEKQSATEH